MEAIIDNNNNDNNLDFQTSLKSQDVNAQHHSEMSQIEENSQKRGKKFKFIQK